MPIDQHNFLGATDTDSPDHVMGRGMHREARNVQFRGMKGNKRLENISSTVARANPFLPNTGINKNICLHYDAVNYRIISFNYNSGGLHGIYVFYTLTKTWFVLIQIGSSTDGDILNFTPDLITSVNIVYNDIADGNLLCFLDCLGRPTCFSIERFLNTPYTLIKRAFIDMAKAPPSMPPKCTYENDNTVTINNLRNALFQFKEVFVYDDGQKSVFSSGSIVPLPWHSGDNGINNQKNLNARISVYVQTGDADVAKLEIWGKQSTDTTSVVNDNPAPSPDYFLIVSLDKGQLSIPDNSIYRFLFYNDGTYTYGDIRTETQLFDSVPIFAGAQDALNGNVIAYGDITEGYDNVQTDIVLNTNTNQIPPYDNINGFLFFAQCNGVDSGGVGNQITLYLTGYGGNDGNGNPTTTQYPNVAYTVTVRLLDGTDKSFSLNIVDAGIADVLVALGAQAVAQGFTIVSEPPATPLSITLSYPQPVVLCSSFATTNSTQPETLFDCFFAYCHQSAYDFAVQYYDKYGKTNGAQPSTNNPITTFEDLTGVSAPQITITIRHRPPIWAKYWQLLRSDTLTYSNPLFWVSNQTFTNTDLNTNQKYAYIGISNMLSYNEDIEASTNVVSYEFQQGDRIRFQVRYPVGLPSSPLTTNLDFEITAVSVDPVINGTIQTGRFIKMLYPTGATSANFDFGGDAFQHYRVLIYSYKKREDNANVLYHEFGKCFGIGNAGTPQAYHMASVQTQTADLITPAIISTLDGDMFYRQRTVPAGMIYYPAVSTNPYVDIYNTFGVTFDTSPVTNSSYTVQNQIASPFRTTGSGTSVPFFINSAAAPQRLRVSVQGGSDDKLFTLQCGASKTATVDIAVGIGTIGADVPLSDFTYLRKSFYLGIGENLQTYNITFDGFVSVNIAATGKQNAWFILVNHNGGPVDTVSVRNGSFILKLEVLDNIQMPIIEPSFSDKYNIVTNSDSRPSVYDVNALQRNYPVRFRWGLADIQSTDINNINRFYFQDYDEFDLSHGAIVRIRARQKEARIFQQRRCGRVGVYNKFLRDNQGQNTLVSTDTIITQNNIQYYEGEWGIGNQGASLISSGYADYFCDPVRGNVIRLSLDGLQNISLLYRVQNWAGDNITPFLSATPYQFGGNNAIIGTYNFTKDKESEAIFCLQGDESFAFNESENTWTAFYDYVPDAITCAENVLYSAYNGVLYSHDGNDYCNFYGTQYKPSITPVYNDYVENKKTWISIAQPSNVPWVSPLIYTEMMSYGTQRQESNLVASDFALLETEWSASFLRDTQSIGGIANGKTLKGGFIVIQMTVTDGSKYVFLVSPKVKYIDSPLNSR